MNPSKIITPFIKNITFIVLLYPKILIRDEFIFSLISDNSTKPKISNIFSKSSWNSGICVNSFDILLLQEITIVAQIIESKKLAINDFMAYSLAFLFSYFPIRLLHAVLAKFPQPPPKQYITPPTDWILDQDP